MSTLLLKALQRAMLSGDVAQMKLAHDELLKMLRDERQPAPDWDQFPAGRDYFLQRWS